MAASLAARLRNECAAQVQTVRGGLGEFTVLVGDEEVVRTSRLWYPDLAETFRAVQTRVRNER